MRTRFFQHHLLVHTHVEKAAGTSFLRGLEQLLGADRVYDERPPEKSTESLTPEQLSRLRLVSGHFHLCRTVEAPEPEPMVHIPWTSWWLVRSASGRVRRNVYLCTLRDPISRLISFYNYVLVRPNHPAHRYVRGRTLDEAVAHMLEVDHPKAGSSQCSIVTGKAQATFEEVLEALHESYGLVVPYRQVGDAIAFLFRLFKGGAPPEEERLNVGEWVDDGISPANLAQLEVRTRDDQRLYEYAKAHYEEFKAKLTRLVMERPRIDAPDRRPRPPAPLPGRDRAEGSGAPAPAAP